MITMFNTMPPPVLPRSRCRSSIIVALSLLAALALLAGCSAIKLGYGQGSALAFTWLDDWVDFDDAQSLRVRGGLDDWFVWHRRTQLRDYADLLARAEIEILEPTTAERTCRWSDELRSRVDPAVDRAMPLLADVAVTLKPPQIANIEKKYAKRNGEYRDDYLQPDPVKRRRAAVKRNIERAERLYGELDAAQRELVARWSADSPFDAEVSFAEQRLRQQDAVRVLRQLGGGPASAAEAEAQIRGYLERLDRSPREAYRRYVAGLKKYNCSYAAALHNSTTAAQRQAAVRTFKGYRDDLRALAAEGAG